MSYEPVLLDLALINLQRLEFFRFLVVVELQASIATALKPLRCDIAATVDFHFQFRILRADLIDGMAGGHVVLFPTFAHGFLFIMQLANVLDGTLQDGTLVLITIRHQARDLIDALVDRLTTSAFHCTGQVSRRPDIESIDGLAVPSLWLFLRIWCHSGEPTDGF